MSLERREHVLRLSHIPALLRRETLIRNNSRLSLSRRARGGEARPLLGDVVEVVILKLISGQAWEIVNKQSRHIQRHLVSNKSDPSILTLRPHFEILGRSCERHQEDLSIT